MYQELLQDRAALYIAGAMSAEERDGFEVLVQAHDDLRSLVTALQATVAALAIYPVIPLGVPVGLKARLMGALETTKQECEPEGMVLTCASGLIEWVNPAFTAMCGYGLEELKGRKPGTILQGPGTTAATVTRIRQAMQERRACRETMVNYHKNGTSYCVDVRIIPLLDDEGETRWYVARERKLPAEAAVTK